MNTPTTNTCDPSLAAVIARIESSDFQYAMRFEPTFVPDPASIPVAARFNECDTATADVIAATSYGLYQIMASNLYDYGMRVSVGEYMGDAALQLQMFSIYLTRRSINYQLSDLLANAATLNTFALRYNGSVAYGSKILSAARVLGL